jgi:hypothetical protein
MSNTAINRNRVTVTYQDHSVKADIWRCYECGVIFFTHSEAYNERDREFLLSCNVCDAIGHRNLFRAPMEL